MTWATAHPARRPQFADRFRPFAGAVGDQADRFADDGDTPAAGSRRPRVPPGQLRLVIGQRSRRDQVPGDELCAVLAQPAQVTKDVGVELVGRRPFRQVRPALTDIFFTAPGTSFRTTLRTVGCVGAPPVWSPIGRARPGRWTTAAVTVRPRSAVGRFPIAVIPRRFR